MRLLRWLIWQLTGLGAFGLVTTGYCALPRGHIGECVPKIA